MRTREELAWAAGFFEGEGCFTANRGRQKPRPVIMVSQVDPEPMERFCAAIGLGAVEYVETRWAPNQQNIHRYRIVGFERFQAIGAMLWPWLSTRRRRQFTDVLAEYHAYGGRGRGYAKGTHRNYWRDADGKLRWEIV